jgi:hypothetical protein
VQKFLTYIYTFTLPSPTATFFLLKIWVLGEPHPDGGQGLKPHFDGGYPHPDEGQGLKE